MSVFVGKTRLVPARRSARVLVAALLLVAAPAAASENYPQAVERALDTPCPPDCTTCHTTPKGGILTANTPVGISMRRAGLEGGDTGLLFDALATLEAEATDSDMDGAPDVEEMRAGTDPNATTGKLKCFVPETEEGCALRGATTRERNDSPWVIGAGLALVALSRRRRVARARPSP